MDNTDTTVSVFCYEDRERERIGSDEHRIYYGKSMPERTGLTTNMTVDASGATRPTPR